MSIIKLCADHLRAFSGNHGVKLKSGHAHELVASFFGYKSKAAMQMDILSPIKNLDQAKIFVLMPSLFIEERRKRLEYLPSGLPDAYTLGEEMFACLASEGRLAGRFFASWEHLAEVLTNEYLQKNGNSILPINFGPYEKARHIFNKPIYEFNPKIETTGNGIKLTATNKYYGSSDVHFQSIDLAITITLQRIAGYIGYANPEISIIDISNQLTK
ncbi:hypothetical protein [Legionella feeleii]|uniref:Uncharacterized protein n=1 Tax=Legionella feeleii TaxID=453 RepID=A0A378IX80_9GAMM|nr:hypothetical protein [Legionella feeleii]STX39848.1 Uncharacterised protein [Legionella feeleii]